jgi:signal transduction histidine kinase
MQETDHQVVIVIVAVLVLLVVIVLVVLLLAVYYSNTKQKLIREKEILKTTYEKAILEAQFEIQEQTLRNASQEIHDNIGQVLSYVSLSLDRASGLDESSKNAVITESRALVNQSMNDLRDLSKSFSLDNIISNGLLPTIKAEVVRLNKSRLIEAVINIEGSVYSIGEHQELVLFRILQEFVNNTLKHAKARHLTINLQYNANKLTLSLNDDGVGFDFEAEQNKNGSGLRNMRTRAGLIGAEVTASSEPGKGSQLIIQLNKAS